MNQSLNSTKNCFSTLLYSLLGLAIPSGKMDFSRYCIVCGQEVPGEKFSRVSLRASLLETFFGVETLTHAAEMECKKKKKNLSPKWVLKKDEN